MQAILVANPKGGSGKTTLAVNIAGYLAATGRQVTLLDLDRQRSASLWLQQRASELPMIWPLDGNRDKRPKADWLVIDSPAGLHGKNLERAVKLCSKIVVPISPSLFDMQASREFLQDLSEEKALRKGRVEVAIVGMRTSARTRAASLLEQFLGELDLPILAYLREAQIYVNASFEGKSIFDVPLRQALRDRAQWEQLQDWLES